MMKDNCKYFDCNLQTENGNVRAVCFSPQKRENFEVLRDHMSPVKIKKFSTSEHFGQISVLIQDQTKVNKSPKKLSFERQPSKKPMQYHSIQELHKVVVGQIVSVKAHVDDLGPVKKTNYEDQPGLNKQDGTLVDTTGSIKVTMYGK